MGRKKAVRRENGRGTVEKIQSKTKPIKAKVIENLCDRQKVSEVIIPGLTSYQSKVILLQAARN